MNKIPFSGEYSMNNITIPTKSEHKSKLVRKTELFIGRVRWKYFWATNEKRKNQKIRHPQIEMESEKKETYGF